MQYDDLPALTREIQACRLCAEDFGYEPHPVCFGAADARIMQIGQAPSRTVHGTGLPFSDASGARLRHEWYGIDDATFYDPHRFYITAVAHCWPGNAKGGGDRPPPRRCAKAWLRREMALVNARLYIIIGGSAAGFLFPGRPFTELVFQDLTLEGKPALVLPHPSPRNVRWMKEHPAFETERLPQVRRAVHQALEE